MDVKHLNLKYIKDGATAIFSDKLLEQLQYHVLDMIVDSDNQKDIKKVDLHSLNSIADIFAHHYIDIPEKLESIEFIFSYHDYKLRVLTSSNEDIYFFLISIPKEIFETIAYHMSIYLNNVYQKETHLIDLQADFVAQSMSGQAITIYLQN